VPLTITKRGFTAFFAAVSRCQLLIVIGNPKHSAFRIRIGDVVSDSAGLFAALAAISHWTCVLCNGPTAGRPGGMKFRVCEFWYKRCCGKPRSLAPLGSIELFSQLPPSLSHFFQSHTVPFRLGFLSETVAFLRKL